MMASACRHLRIEGQRSSGLRLGPWAFFPVADDIALCHRRCAATTRTGCISLAASPAPGAHAHVVIAEISSRDAGCPTPPQVLWSSVSESRRILGLARHPS